jgi:hypothetical protein
MYESAKSDQNPNVKGGIAHIGEKQPLHYQCLADAVN